MDEYSKEPGASVIEHNVQAWLCLVLSGPARLLLPMRVTCVEFISVPLSPQHPHRVCLMGSTGKRSQGHGIPASFPKGPLRLLCLQVTAPASLRLTLSIQVLVTVLYHFLHVATVRPLLLSALQVPALSFMVPHPSLYIFLIGVSLIYNLILISSI